MTSSHIRSAGCFSIAAMGLVCVVARAQEPTLQIEAFAKVSRAEREAKIVDARSRLNAARSSKAKSQADIDRAIDDLRHLSHPSEPYYAVLPLRNAAVGDVGRLADFVRVVQVLDDNNSLIQFEWSIGTTSRVRVGKETAIVSGTPIEKDRLFWLANYLTRQATDDASIRLDGVFGLVGTKTYDAEIGTNTVAVLTPVDLSKYADQFGRKNMLRNWTTRDGKITSAVYIHHLGSRVTVMGVDGKDVTLNLNTLVPADRQFVNDTARAEAKARISK